MVVCWCGCLLGARCRLFAYGPADAATSPNLLLHLNPDWFLALAYPGCAEKGVVKRV